MPRQGCAEKRETGLGVPAKRKQEASSSVRELGLDQEGKIFQWCSSKTPRACTRTATAPYLTYTTTGSGYSCFSHFESITCSTQQSLRLCHVDSQYRVSKTRCVNDSRLVSYSCWLSLLHSGLLAILYQAAYQDFVLTWDSGFQTQLPSTTTITTTTTLPTHLIPMR